jgi:hypothetical protein
MEGVRSSETSVNFSEVTRRHIPEDITLHSHRRDNFKSDINAYFILSASIYFLNLFHEVQPYQFASYIGHGYVFCA